MDNVFEVENSQEEWRAIPDFAGYEVSNLGRVRRSALFDPFGRQVDPDKPVSASLGGSPKWHLTRYMEVSLRIGESTRRHRKVHHLVAAAFIGPRPEGMVICHNNGDNLDNRAENLRYDTQHANIVDMHTHRGGHHNALRETCINGHDITNPDNVYGGSQGRKCKECQRKRARDRHARIRAEKG